MLMAIFGHNSSGGLSLIVFNQIDSLAFAELNPESLLRLARR
jgi:hypothetical protein